MLGILAYLFLMLPFVALILACCCGNCTIYKTDFSTNVIADFSQRAGSWSISGGVLTTSSASALLRCETALPSTVTGGYASVAMNMGSTATAGRLCIAISSDSDYWYAELQPGATNGTLKLFQKASGIATQRGVTQTVPGLAANVQVVVCLSIGGGEVHAKAITASGSAQVGHAYSASIASTKAGVGTGVNGAGVTFDDFDFEKHVADDATCLNCTMGSGGSACCCDLTLPDTLFLTITAPGTNCCHTCAGTAPVTDLALSRISGGNNCAGPSFCYSSGAATNCVGSACTGAGSEGPLFCDVNRINLACQSLELDFCGTGSGVLSQTNPTFGISVFTCSPFHVVGTLSIVVGGSANVTCGNADCAGSVTWNLR
jgi:hypothetical protein